MRKGIPRGPDGVRGALWRGLAVWRWAALGYAVVVVGRTLGDAGRPALGFTLFGVMVAWSVVVSVVGPAADRRGSRWLGALVLADVVLCAAMVVATDAVDPPSGHALPLLWSASGVYTAALTTGSLGGLVSGLVLSVATFVQRGEVNDDAVATMMLFLLSGGILGFLGRTALRAEAAMVEALEARASDAERERLAREVHDSVLQVLALIAREAPRDLPAADVARLAAEQEAALRDLVRVPRVATPAEHAPARFAPARFASTRFASARFVPPRYASAGVASARVASGGVASSRIASGRTGRPAFVSCAHPRPLPEADLAASLTDLTRVAPAARPAITLATPGAPVPLPREHVVEITAAVRAALDNVGRHAGPSASAWVLLEDDGDEVVVTVRDDGIGIAAGRVDQAAAEGRLGLAVSVTGRIRDLGGRVLVTGRPGLGTEVELHVPRR